MVYNNSSLDSFAILTVIDKAFTYIHNPTLGYHAATFFMNQKDGLHQGNQQFLTINTDTWPPALYYH